LTSEADRLVDRFLRVERLQDVVICADLGCTCLVERAVRACHQDDRSSAELWIGFDSPRDLVSVEAGKRRVHEGDVRTEIAPLLKRSLAALDGQ